MLTASLNVALVFNLKKNAPALPGSPADAWDDLDSERTIEGLTRALESGGHRVTPLEFDDRLYLELLERRDEIDLVFNIAEGHFGPSREAQVPAMLDQLHIPYTGSGVLALALTLDKPMTKRVLAFHGLPTPNFQVFHTPDDPLDPTLSFPLFVKPSREGTGTGITGQSIVWDERALRTRVGYVIASYRQPALVEQFIDGREVTVGLVGNVRAGADRARPFHLFPPLEVDFAAYPPEEAGVYTNRLKVELAEDCHVVVPAPLESALWDELRRLTVATFCATECRDVARVDFRLDARAGNQPYILEINPLPGLSPGLSDLCLMAEADGMRYEDLILRIVDEALDRQRTIAVPRFGREAAPT